jgi:hypothetical protein
VPAGAISANFPVNTDTVDAVTLVDITGNYQASRASTLTVNPQ